MGKEANIEKGLGIAALIGALALGGLALSRAGKPASAAGAGGDIDQDGEFRPWNSEQYPAPTTSEGGGNVDDTMARLGVGETPDENLYTTIPGAETGQAPPMIGVNGSDDSRFAQRNISEVLGWTPEEYQKGFDVIVGERFGGIGPGIPGPEMTAEQRYAYNYNDTMAQAEYVVQRNKVIAELGGSWEKGWLQPGPDYANATQLSLAAAEIMKQRYPGMVAARDVANKSSEVTASFVSTPAATPAAAPSTEPAGGWTRALIGGR